LAGSKTVYYDLGLFLIQQGLIIGPPCTLAIPHAVYSSKYQFHGCLPIVKLGVESRSLVFRIWFGFG